MANSELLYLLVIGTLTVVGIVGIFVRDFWSKRDKYASEYRGIYRELRSSYRVQCINPKIYDLFDYLFTESAMDLNLELEGIIRLKAKDVIDDPANKPVITKYLDELGKVINEDDQIKIVFPTISKDCENAAHSFIGVGVGVIMVGSTLIVKQFVNFNPIGPIGIGIMIILIGLAFSIYFYRRYVKYRNYFEEKDKFFNIDVLERGA